MLINIKFLIIFLYIFGLNIILNKLNFLKDKKSIFKHKNFINNRTNPPFSGGLYLIISILIFIPNNFLVFKIFLFLMFLIGFFSDLNVLKSPNFRFLLQILVVIIFVSFLEINISSIRIEKIDFLLENIFFNIFFTSFCILIIINGTNFIDGVNTSVLGYYLILLIALSNLLQNFGIESIGLDNLKLLIFCLICLFILNFFELLYLGDNGAYLVSLLAGILLIEVANENDLISPYYIVNLLWYPAFEILFSMIRKIKSNLSAFIPDNYHLHQLLYLLLKKNFGNKKIINTLTGSIINLYHLIFVLIVSTDFSNTKYQIFMTFVSISFYSFIYFLLKKIILRKGIKKLTLQN